LQSSQLALAQQLAKTLQSRGLQWPLVADADPGARQNPAAPGPCAWYASGLRRIDFSA